MGDTFGKVRPIIRLKRSSPCEESQQITYHCEESQVIVLLKLTLQKCLKLK